MSLAEQLAALAVKPERVTCHACRLLALYEGEEREQLVAVLATRVAAKRISEVIRENGEVLPEQHIRDHRNETHPS